MGGFLVVLKEVLVVLSDFGTHTSINTAWSKTAKIGGVLGWWIPHVWSLSDQSKPHVDPD